MRSQSEALKLEQARRLTEQAVARDLAGDSSRIIGRGPGVSATRVYRTLRECGVVRTRNGARMLAAGGGPLRQQASRSLLHGLAQDGVGWDGQGYEGRRHWLGIRAIHRMLLVAEPFCSRTNVRVRRTQRPFAPVTPAHQGASPSGVKKPYQGRPNAYTLLFGVPKPKLL
jgi:hypothetical protein